MALGSRSARSGRTGGELYSKISSWTKSWLSTSHSRFLTRASAPPGGADMSAAGAREPAGRKPRPCWYQSRDRSQSMVLSATWTMPAVSARPTPVLLTSVQGVDAGELPAENELMDLGCAVRDRQHPGVPEQLFRGVAARQAHGAVHLAAQRGHPAGGLAGVRLGP